MDSKNNVLKRISRIFLNRKEMLKEIANEPTSWKWIFLLLVGILTMFAVYAIQVPSMLTSILILASGLPDYMIVSLFMVVMVIVAILYFIFVFIVYIVGIRLRKGNQHRSSKVIFNLYVYSLSPILLLATQIPFILIFGGHYTLLNLAPFFAFILGLTVGWHAVILYNGIQTNSTITPKGAKIVTICYLGSLGALTGFLIYAILYIPFSITWLGALV